MAQVAHPESDTLKILAAGMLFVLTLLSGTLPVHLIEYISKRSSKSKLNGQTSSQSCDNSNWFTSKLKVIFVKDRIVQFLAQLGGGVLLYTSVIEYKNKDIINIGV